MLKIIAGKFKNMSLQAPKGDETRPTTGQMREACFNILQSQIENASVLDLFAGSGAMGLEAVSRGATDATFVEKEKAPLESIKKNIAKLAVADATRLIPGDVFKVLPRLQQQYDIIFADPPYGKFSKELLLLINQTNLLRAGGEFWLEESTDFSCEGLLLKNLSLFDTRKYGRSRVFRFQGPL